MAALPDVLGCRALRRTAQVRLGTNTLRLAGGTPIFVISPHHAFYATTEVVPATQ